MTSGEHARPGGQGGAQDEAGWDAPVAGAWAHLLPQDRRQQTDALQPITAGALGALPPGWTALHDRRCPEAPRTTIDHVVIGPAGVFVIASATWSGSATVADGVLFQDGRPREALVAEAADGALPVAQLVGTGTGSVDVHPVLCISGAGGLAGRSRGVLVCSPDTLVRQLASQPPVLDAAQAADLAFRLDLELHGTVVRAEPNIPRLLPALTIPPHLLAPDPSHARPVVAEPGRPAPDVRKRRRGAMPTEPDAPADRRRRVLERRQRERERSRRARLSRRIANAVLLVVVLVTFGPAASSVVSHALGSLTVHRTPVLPVPSTPATSACPTLQGQPSTCSPDTPTQSGVGR